MATYAPFLCKRNIEMTPLCKVDVTLPGVRGASETGRVSFQLCTRVTFQPCANVE
jgi:hypothetical protein